MGGFRVWLELQLGGVHDLDFGYIDWDDDSAGWDGRLSRKLDNGVILLSDVSTVTLTGDPWGAYLVPLVEPLAYVLGWSFQGTQQIIPAHGLIGQHIDFPN